MTRHDLEKVYWLKRELKMWKQRLEELRADISQDTIAPDGMPHSVTNKISSPTESKAVLLVDHEALIRGKEAEIRLAVIEVERFILSVEDPLMRMILEYRCVECLTWKQMEDRLGNKCNAKLCEKKYHNFVKNTTCC